MPERYLIDTDVLIDYSRRHPKAMEFMRALDSRPVVSAITVAELYAGVRDGRERAELDLFVTRSVVVDVDVQASVVAGLWLRQYRRSHGVGLADALIAAAAQSDGATVVTLNVKHYPMFSDVLVPYAKP
jgi:predicted nucleic acid-binding protein